MPQVPVEPLFPQRCDECGQQRDQKARIQETIDNDDLPGRVILGGGTIWDCGMVEGEEDSVEESCRLFVGVWLKLFIDIDDESRANCGEQARLQDWVRSSARALEE